MSARYQQEEHFSHASAVHIAAYYLTHKIFVSGGAIGPCTYCIVVIAALCLQDLLALSSEVINADRTTEPACIDTPGTLLR